METVASLSALLPPQAVTAEYLRLLSDKDASLLTHPALHYAGDAMGNGSHTFKIPQIGLDGYRSLEQVAEGYSVQYRALDTDDGTVTVAPWRKGYQFSDLAQAVGDGKFGPAILARDGVMATANTLVDMLGGLVGSFSSSVADTGEALTGVHILTAVGKLGKRSVKGRLACVLSGQQYSDFQLWLATTANAGGIPWMAATQAQLVTYGEGYQGAWGPVDIFVSNRIPTTNGGADHAGGVFGYGAISWADCSFAQELDPNIVDFGGAVGGRGRVRFERVRDGRTGATGYVTHAQLGMAEQQDAAGESLITRAAA